MRRLIGELAHLGVRRVRWALGDRSPLVASVKLTRRCNLACAHCPWTGTGEELSTRAWQRILSDLVTRGVRHLVLEGGEPTERDDLALLIQTGRALGARVTVATNGARDLSAYAPDRFLISIDGPPAVHDQVRGAGTAAAVRASLATAKAPAVALVSLGAHNRDQIAETLSAWAEHVDGFWLSFLYDYRGCNWAGLPAAERGRLGAVALELARDFRLFNTASFLRKAGSGGSCAAWLMTTVTADGRERSGCSVAAIEPPDCEYCDLACHRELSGLLSWSDALDQARTHLGKPWLTRFGRGAPGNR